MPPKKEPCRNFLRGVCQYGERCKFLHATQQTRPSPFGASTPTTTPFQASNTQQKPNPFGFGVQSSSQPRGAADFGSKQNQFKPFENKWTRQSDNQPQQTHKCTDPESCKRQIIEDFEHEKPLWKLTCYGHNKSSPCDIVGDISCEELRAAAYDDAKQGLSLQSIVERERSLLNAKLVEFGSLLRNPYAVSQSPALSTQSAFSAASFNASAPAPSSSPLSVSSFSQLGASPNMGFGHAKANNAFGQSTTQQTSFQTTGGFVTNTSPFGRAGSPGNLLPNQLFGSTFSSSTASFASGAAGAGQNVGSFQKVSPHIPSSANKQSLMVLNGSNEVSPEFPSLTNNQSLKVLSGSNFNGSAAGQSSLNIKASDGAQGDNGAVDKNIWLEAEWIVGQIPEEAPPDDVIV